MSRGTVCQDCWEPFADNPLCICRATYEPCPNCGRQNVFTTPREKAVGAIPINCPCLGGSQKETA